MVHFLWLILKQIFTEPRIIIPGVALYKVSWVLPHLSSVNTFAHRYDHESFKSGKSLKWGCLFYSDSWFCWVDNKIYQGQDTLESLVLGKMNYSGKNFGSVMRLWRWLHNLGYFLSSLFLSYYERSNLTCPVLWP